MKLHLPHGLRKALMACMASLALALPTTLATASGIAGALVAFQLLSAPQAAAIDVGIDYGEATPYTKEETVTGAKWFSGITGDSVLHVQGGADLKLSTTGENGNLTLDMSGAINSLYFASDEESGGTFRFGRDGGTWQTADGTSIKDIYVDNAELWFDGGGAVDLGNANVHLNGEIAGNAYSGALRGRNSASITIGGNLDVMGDTQISLQSGSNIIVNGQLTGAGDLLIGAYNDVGSGAVQLHRGGTLNGQLIFWGDGEVSSRLVLGDTAADGGAVSLSVAGLASKTEVEGQGGILKASGKATVVLTGSGEYIYRGKLGTEAAQTENGVGWTDASTLNLTVQLGTGGKQVLGGDTHLNDLTVSGGTLETAATVQVDGALNANGGTLTLGEGAMLILKATTGTIHLGTLNLTGNATLSLTGEQFDGLKLEATGLPQGGTNKLHIALTSGFMNWLAGQSDGYQLFGAGNWQDIVVFDEVGGHTVEWGSDGKITLAEAVPSEGFTWNAAADGASFTWSATAADGANQWSTGEGTTDGSAAVTMDSTAAAAEVTLSGGVQAGSLTLTGGNGFTFKADGGGTLTLAGGLTLDGNTTLVCNAAVNVGAGLTINADSNFTGDKLVVSEEGASLTVSGDIVVSSDNGSIKVVGGGSLTAAHISGGSNTGNGAYFSHGHASELIVGDDSGIGTVTVGTQTANDALLQVRRLVVTGEESSVTVWGDLSSSYRDASSITGGTVVVSGNMVQNAGELTIDGGMLTVGGYYAGSSQDATVNGGAIILSNGGSMSVGGGLHSTAVTLGTGTNLAIQGGTLTAGTLDATGGGTLTVTMTDGGGNLDISALMLADGGKLSITLTGYDAWANGHLEGGEYQLFNAEHFGTLWGELSGGTGTTDSFFEFEVQGQEGLEVTLSETGALTFGEAGTNPEPGPETGNFTWTVAAGAANFTWDAGNGAGSNTWTNGSGATGSESQVTMTNDAVEGGATVTLSGGVQAGSLTFAGAHGFTLQGSGTLTLAGGLTVNTTLTSNATVTAGGGLSGTGNIQMNGGGLTFNGTGDVTLGGWLSVAGGTFSAANAVVKLGGGLSSDNLGGDSAHRWSGTVNVKSLESTVGEGKNVQFEGKLTVTETLTKKGAGKQTIYGGSPNIGSIDVQGGTLRFGGTDLSGGNAAHIPSLATETVTVSGGILEWEAGDLTATSMALRGGEAHVLRGSVNVTGTLTLGAGTSVVLRGGTLTAGTLDATGGGTLTVTMTDGGGNLDISALTLADGGKLSITLTGYDAWANGHLEGGEYQLFNAEHFGTLWGALSGGTGTTDSFFEFVVEGQPDVGVTLSETGALTFGEAGTNPGPGPEPGDFTWTVAAGADNFTWDAASGASGTPWTSGEGATSESSRVTMTNDVVEGGAVVTLRGAVQAGSLTFAGAHGFTLQGGGTLTLAGGLTVNTTLTSNATVTAEGGLSGTGNILMNGGGLTFNGTGDVTLGGWLSVAEGTFSATGADVKLGGGLSSDLLGVDNQHRTGGTVSVKSLESTVGSGEVTFEGTLTVTEKLTKKGAGAQVLISGGNLSMGSVDVEGGTLTLNVPESLKLTAEGMSPEDSFIVNVVNAGLTVTGDIVVSDSVGKTMNVVGGGSLTAATIAGGGGEGYNPEFFQHGHAPALKVGDASGGTGVVTVGTEGGTDALLQVKQLTVIGAGSRVTVWGNLSSSYGDASSITGGAVTVSGGMVQRGALTIDGGTLEVGGYYANASNNTTANAGAITLSNGGRMSVGGGLHSTAVNLEGAGSVLTLAGANQNTVGGTLTMGAGTRVVLQGGTLAADTLAAETEATLTVTMTADGNNLDVSHLRLGDGGELSITLEGYGAWAAEHPEEEGPEGEETGGRKYQLFNAENFGTLWGELEVGEGHETKDSFFAFTVEGDSFLSYTLDETGVLTIKQDDGFTWNGSTSDVWGEGGNWTDKDGNSAAPDTKDIVTFGESAERKDVQLAGGVEVGGVQVKSGEFTFASSGEGGSLAAKELIVCAGARLNLQTTLKAKEGAGSMFVVLEGGGENLGRLDVREGSVLGDGVQVRFKGGVVVYSENSASEDIVSGKVDAVGSTEVAKVEVTGGQSRQWGSDSIAVDSNSGLTWALNKKGLEKRGEGGFTLAWQGDEQEHAGELTVTEGTLTLAVGGEKGTQLSGKVTIGAGGGLVVPGGNMTLSGAITDEGRLTISGGNVTLNGSVAGAGRLAISGGNVTLSGSNTVTEIELGAGTSTTVTGAGALGGASTTLILSGGTLSGNGATAGAGTVDVSGGAVVSGVTLSGKVTGSAALTAADGAVAGLSGDVSGYSGTLDTGASGTWKLSGAALTDAVGTAVGGDGTVQFDGAATYGGRVEGNVTLEGLGEEGLTVVSTESSAGAKLKGRVTLGNADTHAQWNGQEVVAEGSSVTLSNVTLAEGGGFTTKAEGVKFYVDTARAAEVPSVAAADAGADAVPTGGVVDVSGMDAGKLDGIIINEHGRLTGVGGTYTAGRDKQLELHFSAENMGEMAEEGQALVEGRKGFVLDATSKYDVNLDMSNVVGSILEVLTAPGGGEVYLHLLQGGTLTMGELGLGDFEGLEIFESVVKKFGVRVIGGEIVLTGAAENVYMVTGGETMDAAELKDKRAIVFTAGKSATFTTGSEATLHNLLGESGSALRLQKGDGAVGEVTFTLDNTHADDIIDADSYPEVDRTTVRGQDTKFLGSISGEAGVNVVKDGRGTLTVGGNYTLEDGSTTLRHGRLVLQGTENRMDKLVFDYNPDVPVGEGEVTEPQTEEQRGLVLDRGETFIGTISETGADRNGNEVQLQHGAKLTLSGTSALSGTRIVSGDSSGTLTLQKATEDAEAPVLALSGAGEALLSGLTVNVKDGATLTVSGTDAAVKGSKLNVENGTVQLAEGAVISDSSAAIAANGVLDLGGNAANQLTALSGSGTLKSAAGGAVTVGGGSFSGTLSSSEEGGGAGTLVVAAGANFTLDNVNTTAATPAWGVEVKDGAHLTIDVTKKGKENILTLGDINLGTGNTVTIRLNAETYDGWDDVITGNALTFGANTTVVLDAIVGTENWSPNRKLTLGKFESVSDTDNLKVQLKGAAFVLSQVQGVTWGEDHRLEVQLTAYQGNHFADVVPRGEKNVLAGAEMAWHSFNDRIANGTVGSGDYAMVMKGLSAMLEANDTAGLQRGLAAVAGASISTLAPAFSEDMHRQLTSIRNRTTTMASDVTRETYDKLPIWHAWINAESNYRKLDAEGLTPGYELNSWGGTVGVDADLNRHLTVGLAVTAMYGDLETESADSATGDLDTTYLSLFMRATHGSWIHTLVVSCGRADAELNRTIPYGLSTCRTSGTTDGYAYGVMYEVGYSRLVNKRETAALQPVFNVELRHVSLKGYTEFGSDIGLNTEDTDQTVVTFGAGARTQLAVGANAFNRTTVFEARALLKADVGDRSGTVRNAITGDSTRAEVESAEVGAVGVEIGAGLNVPLGAQFGSAFLDGSLEFRDGMTAANATIGYRVNF